MLTSEAECIKDEIRAWAGRGGERSGVIDVLRRVQSVHRHVSAEAMQAVAEHFGMQPAEVYGIVSFYPYLTVEPTGHHIVRLCRGLCCDLAGKDALAAQVEAVLGVGFGDTTPDGEFTLAWADCLGACDQGPALAVDDRLYTRVTPGEVAGILQAVRDCGNDGGGSAARWTRREADGAGRSLCCLSAELGHGLGTALARGPEDVARSLAVLGLGGPGVAHSQAKYVVCNSDAEGACSPAARVLLADYPDAVIEGMTIAGYAAGAVGGIVYLRAEYADLLAPLEACLQARRDRGLLGRAILGKDGFALDVEVRLGLGMHVGADASALVAFLEGERGEPGVAPVSESGRGAYAIGTTEAFARAAATMARRHERATDGWAIYSVLGDCQEPGLYECDPRASIADALALAGGGDAAAVLLGGPSGYLVRAAEFGRPLGGDPAMPRSLIALGRQRDLLQVVRQGLELSARQSCGQCTPCREGMPRLLDGVERLARRSCSDLYLMELCSLAKTMRVAAKCAIGRTAPCAFLSYVGAVECTH